MEHENPRQGNARGLGLLGLFILLSFTSPSLGRAQDSPTPTRSLLDEADALYARRGEGARGSVADPKPIDEAIGRYRRALQRAPADGEALFRLLRALHFRGAFCGAAVETQRAVFDEGRQLGQAAVVRIERGLQDKKPAERMGALRKVPRAADLYFWTAACWGQWALARGKLAAARQGAAGRVRDLAQTVIELEPSLEEGGGHRVLGRLHDQAPRILFLTGWVSREKALLYLRTSHEMAPQNSATRFFLADAILNHDEKNKDEARRLLQSLIEDAPRPEYLIEDRFYAEEARRRLMASSRN